MMKDAAAFGRRPDRVRHLSLAPTTRVVPREAPLVSLRPKAPPDAGQGSINLMAGNNSSRAAVRGVI
ncbi:MAG: hypothetical protein V4486_00695 [Patescibacteria group bacterium]